MTMALETLTRAAETNRDGLRSHARSILAALDDCYDVGRSVKLDALSKEQFHAVSSVRSHIVQARNAAAMFEGSEEYSAYSFLEALENLLIAVIEQQRRFAPKIYKSVDGNPTPPGL